MFFVIAISGKIGSGKSSISRRLAQYYNFGWVSFGDYVRKIANERKIEHTRTNLQDLGESLLKEDAYLFCYNVINQSILIEKSFVIDGIRHLISLEQIKKIVYPKKVFHIHLDISEEKRLERIIQREKIDSIEDIANIDNHLSEKQVRKLLEIADLVVSSDESSENILNTITNWIEQKTDYTI